MTRTILLTLVVTFTSAFVSYAQEGDPIEPEEKLEPVVMIEQEADSAQYVDAFPSDDEVKPQSPVGIIPNNKIGPAILPSAGEKTAKYQKPKTTSTKSSYNFLYYLFYKFKKVED